MSWLAKHIRSRAYPALTHNRKAPTLSSRPMGNLIMADENRGGRRVLKSLVRFDGSGKLKPREGRRYDATRPSFLIFTTIAYAVAVIFIITNH